MLRLIVSNDNLGAAAPTSAAPTPVELLRKRASGPDGLPGLWAALTMISSTERMDICQLCLDLNQQRPQGVSLEAAARMFVAAYFWAIEEGEASPSGALPAGPPWPVGGPPAGSHPTGRTGRPRAGSGLHLVAGDTAP